MSDTNSVQDSYELLMAKVSQLIKAQTAGEASGFSVAELNHVYMSLVDGSVDEVGNALLIKIAGPDWAEGLTFPEEEDEESAAKDLELAEVIEQIDENNPTSAVKVLASALMLACRELGWLETSRAAHDLWFHAVETEAQ